MICFLVELEPKTVQRSCALHIEFHVGVGFYSAGQGNCPVPRGFRGEGVKKRTGHSDPNPFLQPPDVGQLTLFDLKAFVFRKRVRRPGSCRNREEVKLEKPKRQLTLFDIKAFVFRTRACCPGGRRSNRRVVKKQKRQLTLFDLKSFLCLGEKELGSKF